MIVKFEKFSIIDNTSIFPNLSIKGVSCDGSNQMDCVCSRHEPNV